VTAETLVMAAVQETSGFQEGSVPPMAKVLSVEKRLGIAAEAAEIIVKDAARTMRTMTMPFKG
jgi:hypothetical protein